MITFSSPLTFDYVLAKGNAIGVDLPSLIDRIGETSTTALKIDEATFGRGQFVSKVGDNYLFGWTREGGLRVVRSRSYAPMIRWVRLYGTLVIGDRVFKMHATVYASGNIVLSLSLKMHHGDVKSATDARDKSREVHAVLLPAAAQDLATILGTSTEPSFAVMNASMSGSTRRTFAKNMYYFSSTVATVKKYLETMSRDYIVIPVDSIEGPPRPYTFKMYEPAAPEDVAQYFSYVRAEPRPGGQVLFAGARLTGIGARKFPEVSKHLRERRGGGIIDALVNFKSGDVGFLENGIGIVHAYEAIFAPERVVDVLIWNTGSIQITGSDDFNFGFKVYATLDAFFERDAATMFIGTNAPPKNRAPVERRGANRRPTERGRSGRREGTTCKPPDRIPIPGNFEGACPAGMHVRPNAQGFPCCFKDAKSTAGIRKAYLQAKIPIPQRLIARYPDLAGAGAGPAGPTANRNRNAPAVGVDAKGRLLLNRKICARQPVQIIEAAVAAMGVSTTRSPSPRKGQVVKKTRAEMCGDVQFLRLPELDLRIINDDLEALRAFIRGFGKIAEDMPTPASRQEARALITSILAARTGSTTNEARTNEARTNEARTNEARSTRSSASSANLLRNLENAFANNNVVPPTVRANNANVVPPTVRANNVQKPVRANNANVVPPTVRANNDQKPVRANNVQKTVRANNNLLRNAFANENRPAKPAKPAPKPKPAKPAPTKAAVRNMAQPPAAKPRLAKRPAAAAKPRPMLNIAGTRPSAVPERPFVARKRPVVEYDDMPNINFDRRPLKDIFKNINKSAANINVPQPQQPKPQPQQPKTQPQQPKPQPQQPKPQPQPQPRSSQRNDFRKLKRNYDILNRIFGFR